MPLLFTFSEYLQAEGNSQLCVTTIRNCVSIQSRVTDNHCYIIGSVSGITVLPVAPVLRKILLRAGCHAEAAS